MAGSGDSPRRDARPRPGGLAGLSDAVGERYPPWAVGYLPVLVLLFCFLFVAGVLPARASAVAGIGLAAALWYATARATGLGRRARRGGYATLLLILVIAAIGAGVDSPGLRALVDAVIAASVAALAVVMARSLGRERVITGRVVTGLVCLYLMLGLFFTHTYLAISDVDGDAFSLPAGDTLSRFDLVYFSFITLATIGFGDIVPTTDATRALAATEGVAGQLFLVTVIARAVGMIGSERRSRG